MKLSDLRKLPVFAQGHKLSTLTAKQDSLDEYDGAGEPTDDLNKAEVVTSRVDTIDSEDMILHGRHRPILDIDFPVVVLPSSTEGHHHLYLDKTLTWGQYRKLLEVLSEVGIIEANYAKASIARHHTAVRLPWIKKEV